jgi:hypothetical protein
VFHSTNVSFAWQALLESTKRIIPLPGLMQASSTPGECAATRVVGTITRTTATSPKPAMPARRMKVLLIQFLL